MYGPDVASSLMRHVLPRKMYIRMRKSYIKKHGLEPSISDLLFLVNDRKTDPELRAMVEVFVAHDPGKYLSKFWLQMAQNHVQRLLERGYANFKQTIAVEYFTFAQEAEQSQPNFLKRALPQEIVNEVVKKSEQIKPHEYFSEAQSRHYNLLTTLLWEYAKRQVKPEILSKLQEPTVGNPPIIPYDGRTISQDIANSALEYQSMTDGLENTKNLSAAMEVGAGYGRVAHVFLTLHPGIRYFIVDIPPSLYVSQRYLSEVFPNKRVFRFKDFRSYASVQDEIETSEIIFLMPHQLDLLPNKVTGLFIAINCLNEMSSSVREFYFHHVNRLADNFYFKCHKVAHTPYEGTVLEQDYPMRPDNWKKIYWRDCKVQDYFFEALYSISTR